VSILPPLSLEVKEISTKSWGKVGGVITVLNAYRFQIAARFKLFALTASTGEESGSLRGGPATRVAFRDSAATKKGVAFRDIAHPSTSETPYIQRRHLGSVIATHQWGPTWGRPYHSQVSV